MADLATSSDATMGVSIFKDDTLDRCITANPQNVLSLGYYFPVGSAEFKTDFFSKLILDLKETEDDLKEKIPASEHKAWQISKRMEQKSKIIAWFAKIIRNLFIETQELMFVAVPSSKQNNTMHGPTMLAREIACKMRCICGNGFLLRNTSKKPVHEGGDRSELLQKETLSVIPEHIRGKTIILIDDVVTTGNSLQAAKELLLEAGAHRVICLTIGKTVNALTDFNGSFMQCMERLNGVVKAMIVPTISKYDSTIRSVVSKSIGEILENNLKLFITWQQRNLSRTSTSELLTSYRAASREDTSYIVDCASLQKELERKNIVHSLVPC